MFQSAVQPSLAYEGLPDTSFDRRLVSLTARPRRIAYYYDTPDTSTFRYRVLNMIQAVAADPACDISASWFCRADMDRMDRFVDRTDALVICRARWTPAVDRLVTRAKVRGIDVLFDCDDLVFNPDYAPLIMGTLDQDITDEAGLDFWYGMCGRIGAVMRLCDGAIATNPFLAKRMEEYAQHVRSRVIPNYLNSDQLKLSARLYQHKRDAGFRSDGTITIGYFSGTPTHNRDFAIAARALGRLMDENPRVRLRIVGFLESRDLLKHASRIDFLPLQDPMNLQRLIAEVEINIAPLQINCFTQCKSELKYFEAAITGTITVATPTHTFAGAITEGENGYLARAHEWDEKLRLACELVDSPARYTAMAVNGFEHAQQWYSWNRHVVSIEAAVFGPGLCSCSAFLPDTAPAGNSAIPTSETAVALASTPSPPPGPGSTRVSRDLPESR